MRKTGLVGGEGRGLTAIICPTEVLNSHLGIFRGGTARADKHIMFVQLHTTTPTPQHKKFFFNVVFSSEETSFPDNFIVYIF